MNSTFDIGNGNKQRFIDVDIIVLVPKYLLLKKVFEEPMMMNNIADVALTKYGFTKLACVYSPKYIGNYLLNFISSINNDDIELFLATVSGTWLRTSNIEYVFIDNEYIKWIDQQIQPINFENYEIIIKSKKYPYIEGEFAQTQFSLSSNITF